MMTPAECDALERLIDELIARPPESLAWAVRMASPDTIAKIQRDAIDAATNGLTVKQAASIRDGLDTDAEVDRALTFIPAGVSAADRSLLLSWLLGEVTRVLTHPDVSAGTAERHEFARDVSDLVGYGVDNFWHTIDPVKLAGLLLKAGLTMTSIELMGWSTSPFFKSPHLCEPLLNAFVAAMRAAKIVTFISVVNDNKGHGKYGDDHTPASSYDRAIRQCREYVRQLGPEGLIIQPVAETQTDWGRAFEVDTVRIFKASGFLTCCNDGAGTQAPKHGEAHNALHHGSTSNVGTDGDLVIGDHGMFLRAVNIGGDVYGMGDPAKVEAYARKVRVAGRRGFGYYGFGHRAIDEATIAAIGRGWGAVAAAPIAGLVFRWIGGRKCDVGWSPSIDRSTWPSKGVSGSECDGLIYGCPVGGTPRKIEWIKRGGQTAHTDNAWAAIGTEYGQALHSGQRVLLQVRDINGGLRNQSYQGEMVLG